MEQQNAQFPRIIYPIFAKAVKPLLDVHRNAAQKPLGSRSGPATALPLPPAAQSSPTVTTSDSSGATYATAQKSTSESAEPAGMEAVETDKSRRDWLREFEEEVNKQIGRQPLRMNLNPSKATVSSTSSTPSPRLGWKATGSKDMSKLKEANAKEREEKSSNVATGKGQAKTGNQRLATPSCSSASLSTTTKENEQPPEKVQVRKRAKSLRRELR